MKRTLALILALMLASSVLLTGCSESTENAETTSESTDTAADAAVTDEEAEPERLYADVPDSNFDGYQFTILCSSNSEYSVIQNDFHAEELTGEVINDARFNRNTTICDKLNIEIVDMETAAVGSTEGYNYIAQDVQGGTAAYDLATCCGYATSSLAMKNFLLDMNTVPYLDLTAAWWDQVANEDLEVLGQLFYTTGDITTSDNDATYCIMFNKQLISDYGLEVPYDMVNDGTWTIDAFIEMATGVSMDLDGDGDFDTDDRYGVMIWDDSMMGVVNCCGVKCTSVGEDGLLTMTLNTEKTVDIVTKFLDFACQKDVACAYQRLNWDDSLLVNMFSNNQSLFLMQLIQIVPKMREMDADFGILPYFKYDEAQEKYYTTVGSWHSVFVCVPNNQSGDRLTRTGIITECLANESLYTLTDAYYEKTLKGKSSRDVESSAMLDIIFATRVYDMGWYYAFGGYNESVMNLLRNYNNNFASMYKSGEKVANKLLEKTNNAFLESKESGAVGD